MRRRGSDGAVAIFVAIITCFVVIPVSAVAVDLGMQRVARRDMQSLADVVALDLSRQLDGRTAATITSASPSLQTLADRSRLRNASAIGSGTTVTPVLGTTDAAGVFTAVSGATVPTAVMVTAHTSVGFVFISGSGQATRTAIAAPTAVACFKLGSFAASIKTGGSTVLGPLLGGLGSGIDLSVLSYQGLASTQVTLGALALALGAGTPTELVNTTVRLDTFYAAVAQALTAQGDTADAAVLNAVKVKLSGAAASTPINVGDLLSVTQGNQSALGLGINAADLIMGAASVADGGSFLSIPGLNVNLPGVTSATTSLKVIEPPKEGCGRANDSRAAADTAQVSLQLSASVLQSFPKVLGLLSVSAGPISLAVQTAQAHGQLTQVICSNGMKVDATTSLVPVTATIPINLSVAILGSLSLTATVTTVPSNPSATTVTLSLPTNVTTPVSTGSGNLNVSSAGVAMSPNGSTGLLGLIGYTLSQVEAAVTTTVIAPIETVLLTPLLNSLSTLVESSLGLTLAGADVYAESVNCASPSLIG